MTGLPTGWALAPINTFARSRSGNSKLIKGQQAQEPAAGLFPAFSASGQDVWVAHPEHEGNAIIISAVGARCGKTFRATGQWSAVANTHIVWPEEIAVDTDWLQLLLNDENFWEKGGSAQPFVKVNATFEREIPLPPLPEQRRIVRKLDTLSARSTTARTHLTAIEKLVERYKLAFYLQIFSSSQEQVELGAVAKVGTGATPKKGTAKYYANGTVPWVTSGAVNAKTVTEPSSFITETAIQETNCKVFPAGSLLVAMYGEGKTRGQVARLEIAAATNQALAVIHELDKTRIDSEYLFRFLDSIYLEIREQAEGGVQPNLSLSKVKSFKVPLPSPEEQREIVSRIETAFAKIDRLKAEAAKALKLLGHLDQRILAKAFAGHLVPQDPTDEPAETLLARIRETKAAAPKSRRGRK